MYHCPSHLHPPFPLCPTVSPSPTLHQSPLPFPSSLLHSPSSRLPLLPPRFSPSNKQQWYWLLTTVSIRGFIWSCFVFSCNRLFIFDLRKHIYLIFHLISLLFFYWFHLSDSSTVLLHFFVVVILFCWLLVFSCCLGCTITVAGQDCSNNNQKKKRKTII